MDAKHCSFSWLLSPHVPATGVKNIHAYSWLAHSRKYLESVEREKRSSDAQKVNLRSLTRRRLHIN